jgi:hypothetical protein
MIQYEETPVSSPAGLLAHYIEQGVLPPAATPEYPEGVVAMAVADPAMAARLEQAYPARDAPGRLAEQLLAEALDEFDPRIRAERVRCAFRRMPPDSAEWMPVVFAGAVGNLRGAPFRHRVTANRIRISAELGRERARPARPNVTDASHRQADGQARIRHYVALLREGRQVILFSPEGAGRLIELYGRLGPDTRNVAVVVPGTGTGMGRCEELKEPIAGLVAAAGGNLAIVVWMDGDLPGAISAGSASRYAAAPAPRLVAFIPDVRQELEDTTPRHADVKITVAGHSYGGAVIGTAERLGLDANRILHVASAGMGNGVRGPADYRNPNRDVQRFSMTAPGDPIRFVQGRGILEIGYGANPDTFPGVIRLETGCYPDAEQLGDKAGRLLAGGAAHGEVWTPGGEAWTNIYNVLTGGRVTLWRGPGESAKRGRRLTGDPPALDVL